MRTAHVGWDGSAAARARTHQRRRRTTTPTATGKSLYIVLGHVSVGSCNATSRDTHTPPPLLRAPNRTRQAKQGTHAPHSVLARRPPSGKKGGVGMGTRMAWRHGMRHGVRQACTWGASHRMAVMTQPAPSRLRESAGVVGQRDLLGWRGKCRAGTLPLLPGFDEAARAVTGSPG